MGRAVLRGTGQTVAHHAAGDRLDVIRRMVEESPHGVAVLVVDKDLIVGAHVVDATFAIVDNAEGLPICGEHAIDVLDLVKDHGIPGACGHDSSRCCGV